MTVSDADLQILSTQLGRAARGVLAIGARCICGNPLVAVTAPRVDGKTPFPTTFYLTHPKVVKAASVLEARGEMQRFNDQLRTDETLQARYRAAHEDYLQRRAAFGQVPEIAGISAGGMPTRVKCLHALVGHALAVGSGINPIGDAALAMMAEEGLWSAAQCECEHPRGAEAGGSASPLAQ